VGRRCPARRNCDNSTSGLIANSVKTDVVVELQWRGRQHECQDQQAQDIRFGVGATIRYEFVAIPDEEVPQAADPLFQHLVTTYASETNKTASMWRAIPDNLLDYRPHQKTNTIRDILIRPIHSEWRFFAQFVGTRHRLALHEPPPAMLEWCERAARIAQQGDPGGG
jgi:hypothetical protein